MIESIALHRFTEERRYFFDTNIWILGLIPIQVRNDWRHASARQAIAGVDSARSRVFVDQLVIAEFLTAPIREEYKKSQTKAHGYPKYKDWRSGEAADWIYERVSESAAKMLQMSEVLAIDPATTDIRAITSVAAQQRLDFNDLLILELCRQNGLTLVTNDADFGGCDVPLVTGNPHLLGEADPIQ